MRWLANNWPTIGLATLNHLQLALPAIAAALVIAIPVAWLAHHFRWTRFTLVTLGSLLYAIPSLPLLVVLPLVIGTGVRDRLNVIAALSIYGFALMIRAATDALDAVPRSAEVASIAMGYGWVRRFLTVELPLSGPGLLAGLRVVSMSTIALVSVSGIVGVNSLGMLFVDGFQRGILAEVVAGIVATVVVALALDGLLVLTGRLLMPWARPEGSRP
ncbi:IM glycine betaine/choline transport protein of ABC transporter [Propionibacterium freudenreichii]|uniref:ABC transporter permease n=1 Tax=Propionibacterium freudenreichii TaxID=1744 RepID=UPI000541A839|nr:ABC transporter permease subunit [Propionibacterium freudenreichii]MCT2992044.1 ABC transporter permease subunit [Propionibacterium freudenreichii]MCT2992580.1 ABC transporter permease subunit [Propionibacterium freudenreichii]MDK9651242.1 ABC transporter permease subunit [Propionibacterium freudenreichii]MDK9664161.1 ABC transporter permease subunit [Propionibacterium freudenreichii]CEH05888.1 IM glycine betaine/choline transport protein of ABC transporter [Propionibacterium freudenreichii